MAAGNGLGVLRTLRHYGYRPARGAGSRRRSHLADFGAAIRASFEELRAAAA